MWCGVVWCGVVWCGGVMMESAQHNTQFFVNINESYINYQCSDSMLCSPIPMVAHFIVRHCMLCNISYVVSNELY